MSKPLVTVGIAFLNSEKTLLNAIKSIFAQTFQDWELILVDDGSTDNSLELARSIDDQRVRTFSDGQNKKLPARLNQIVELARGEFIARMDADDMSHPQRLAKQVEFFNNHNGVDVVGTSMYILNRQIQPTCKITVPPTHNDISKNKFKKIPIAHPTVMAKARWFHQWPYDEKCPLSQDQELWMRSISKSTFANITEPLYLYNEFAATSLSKYVKATRIIAKNIMRYGPSEVGRFRSVYHACIRYSKAAVYAVSLALGLRNRLIRSRYSDLTEEEYTDAKNVIDVILRTEVPICRAGSGLGEI